MSNSDKVLVMGACGNVGSKLVRILLDKGYDVRASDLEDASKELLGDLDVEFVPGDITKPETLQDVVEDVDAVFNTVSFLAYSNLISYEQMYKVNVEGERNLLEATMENNDDLKAFIHWASGETYGLGGLFEERYLHENGESREDHPQTASDAPYPKTKLLGERECWQYYEEKDLPLIVMRPSMIYGPEPSFEDRRWLRYSKYFMVMRDLVEMMGGWPGLLTFKNPLVHAEDSARAAAFLYENKEEAIGEAFNIVDDQNYTMEDIVRFMFDYFGWDIQENPSESLKPLLKGLPLPKPTIRVFKKAYRAWMDEVREQGPIWWDSNYQDYYLEEMLSMENYCEDFKYSNRKIKDLGFEFKYPDVRDALPAIFENWKEKDLVPESSGFKHFFLKAFLLDER